MPESCIPILDQDGAYKKAVSCLKRRRIKFNFSLIRAKTVKLNRHRCEWKVILYSLDEKILLGGSKTYTMIVDDKTGKCTDFNPGPVTHRKKS